MDYVLADLELAMKRLYIDRDVALGGASQLMSEGQLARRRHPVHGDTIQIASAQTVDGSADELGRRIWSMMTNSDGESYDYTFKVRGGSHPVNC